MRRYDKGAGRTKHDWKHDFAGFVVGDGNPRRVIGKCPAGVSEHTRHRLLQKAIPEENGDRDLEAPKTVYVVYRGVIFAARTSDFGMTYHGYPYQGKLAKALIEGLRRMACVDGCCKDFERWVKDYITPHGQMK